MRDESWLQERFNKVWETLFYDVERKNNVLVRFKGRWKNKFGHIRLLKDKSSEIVINSLFKNEKVPEFIIDLTLANELVHYGHGFNSPLERKHKHPHKGNIVNKELVARGFGEMIRREREFVKKEWPLLFKEMHPDYKRRRVRLFRFF